MRTLAALPTVLFCSHVAAAIINTTAAVQQIAPPPDTRKGAIESDTLIFAFAERQNLVLSQSVAVDITNPGTSPGPVDDNLSPGSIPAGTAVNSYLLHFDILGEVPSAQAKHANGNITFDTDVLGQAISLETLNATNSTLGLPGTLYATDINRDLELGIDSDVVTLSADRRTVTVRMQTGANSDDLRIITAAVPEPSSLLCMILAGALVAARRRSGRIAGTTLLACIVCAPALGGIVTVSGDAQVITPPADVTTGTLESNTAIVLFPEQQNVILPAPVHVNISAPGTSPGPVDNNLSPADIPAGTTISSYFLHFDQIGTPTTRLTLSGSATFDTDIIGLIVFRANLNATHAMPGLPTTTYATGGFSDIEFGGGNMITLSPDRRTVDFSLMVDEHADNMRIITAVPEPASALLLCAGGCLYLRRWRR